MAKLTNKHYILLIITSLFILIDFRIATAMMMAYVFNILYQRLLVYKVDYIIKSSDVNSFVYFSSILSLLILALPMLISLLFPNIFHWFGVLLALTYDKLFLYTNTFLGVNND